jgi:hypothetical protein
MRDASEHSCWILDHLRAFDRYSTGVMSGGELVADAGDIVILSTKSRPAPRSCPSAAAS